MAEATRRIGRPPKPPDGRRVVDGFLWPAAGPYRELLDHLLTSPAGGRRREMMRLMLIGFRQLRNTEVPEPHQVASERVVMEPVATLRAAPPAVEVKRESVNAHRGRGAPVRLAGVQGFKG